MGKNKKRAPSASSPSAGEGGVIEQARMAVEAALKDIQKRLPADLVRQVEKTVGEGQKTLQGGLKTIQAQLKTTARQADVDKLTRRVDMLAKQVERMVAGRSTPARPAVPAVQKSARAKATTGRAPASKPTASTASSSGPPANTSAKAPSARAARKGARPADRKPEGNSATSKST